MTESHLKELLDAAVAQAPDGRFDPEEAIRVGRRRRRARNGAVVLAITGVVGLVASGVVVLTSQSPRDLTAAPANHRQSAAVIKSQPSPTDLVSTLVQLESLARQVAAPAGHGTVTFSQQTTAPDGTKTLIVRLHVPVRDIGAVDVTAVVDTSPANGVATWTQSCTLDNGGVRSGRACKPILETATRGIWSRTYADQPGRQSLLLAAILANGATLTLKVDNYAEQPDASKTIGPALNATGITAASIGAVADSVTE